MSYVKAYNILSFSKPGYTSKEIKLYKDAIRVLQIKNIEASRNLFYVIYSLG